MKPNLTFSKFSLFPAATVLAVIILGSSCQKSDRQISNNSSNQQRLDVTNNAIEATNSDEENFELVMDQENTEAANVSNAKVAGKTVTYSPSKDVYPRTKTVDYGTGFTNAKGVVKSGKVIITYYDASKDLFGKYSVTTYNNYYVNGKHIEGTVQINKTKNFKGQDVYVHTFHKTVSTAAGDIKDYYGGSTWTVINWKGGINNAYEISLAGTVGTETYNGVESNGFATHVDPAHPLIKPFTCKYRVQGVVIADIHLANTPIKDGLIQLEERLDFGNGECDDIATLSINGGTPKEVTLPLRFWPLN
ncbi:MAG TPA: hypothetical protein VFW07_27495 [Parafilimonas sp.]|nr:hypothetical protein [Parafilimonas sp.]